MSGRASARVIPNPPYRTKVEKARAKQARKARRMERSQRPHTTFSIRGRGRGRGEPSSDTQRQYRSRRDSDPESLNSPSHSSSHSSRASPGLFLEPNHVLKRPPPPLPPVKAEPATLSPTYYQRHLDRGVLSDISQAGHNLFSNSHDHSTSGSLSTTYQSSDRHSALRSRSPTKDLRHIRSPPSSRRESVTRAMTKESSLSAAADRDRRAAEAAAYMKARGGDLTPQPVTRELPRPPLAPASSVKEQASQRAVTEAQAKAIAFANAQAKMTLPTEDTGPISTSASVQVAAESPSVQAEDVVNEDLVHIFKSFIEIAGDNAVLKQQHSHLLALQKKRQSDFDKTKGEHAKFPSIRESTTRAKERADKALSEHEIKLAAHATDEDAVLKLAASRLAPAAMPATNSLMQEMDLLRKSQEEQDSQQQRQFSQYQEQLRKFEELIAVQQSQISAQQSLLEEMTGTNKDLENKLSSYEKGVQSKQSSYDEEIRILKNTQNSMSQLQSDWSTKFENFTKYEAITKDLSETLSTLRKDVNTMLTTPNRVPDEIYSRLDQIESRPMPEQNSEEVMALLQQSMEYTNEALTDQEALLTESINNKLIVPLAQQIASAVESVNAVKAQATRDLSQIENKADARDLVGVQSLLQNLQTTDFVSKPQWGPFSEQQSAIHKEQNGRLANLQQGILNHEQHLDSLHFAVKSITSRIENIRTHEFINHVIGQISQMIPNLRVPLHLNEMQTSIERLDSQILSLQSSRSNADNNLLYTTIQSDVDKLTKKLTTLGNILHSVKDEVSGQKVVLGQLVNLEAQLPAMKEQLMNTGRTSPMPLPLIKSKHKRQRDGSMNSSRSSINDGTDTLLHKKIKTTAGRADLGSIEDSGSDSLGVTQ